MMTIVGIDDSEGGVPGSDRMWDPNSGAGDIGRVRPGSLLISSTDLSEPTFRRTIIYMIEHNKGGSIGVVLNRMSHTAVHNLLPQWTDLAGSPKAIFVGGPVKQDAALCIGVLRPGAQSDDHRTLRPVNGRVVLVDLDADPDEVAGSVEGVRIFAGYAGWGIGQLEDELRADSWMVVSALASDILAPPVADLWSVVLRRQPWPMSLLSTHPIELERN